MTTPEKRRELDTNFAAFRKMLPDLMKSRTGKYALMRHEKVVEFFDTMRDAFVYALRVYPDDMFSIQEVTTRVVDLGWFSRVPFDVKARA